ncbi:MAG: pantetheine-phosphate adenylyltransferase [Anaerovoracaceae bacterium]|nr:pantetheine-phosphate adenylyltransferase [Bacillota bacterium]MDD7734277.1 pantetheine-phosphate adenylyltransferase [Bacillota bacterium]MDY5906075.1 pantetheine-phosphate adenylyltransferase [Anaerovoracaceae bacterium]
MKKFLYPGSFDPLTMGHLDIIRRASKLCDTLIIGIVTNSSKTPLFSVAERKKLIAECLKHEEITNYEIVDFSGLLVEYVRENQISCIVRGLRDTPDFTSEMPRAYMSKHLYEDFETVFLLTSLEHSYVSSSAIKELLYFDGKIDGLVPENVQRYIEERNIGGKK